MRSRYSATAAARARHEADVRDVPAEGGHQRLLVPLALARDDDVGRPDRVEAREVTGGVHVDAAREEIAAGGRVDRRDLPAGPRAEVRERPGDRRDADNPQLRRRELRLDEDLQRAT